MEDMNEVLEDLDWLDKEPPEDCKKVYHAIQDLGGDATAKEISKKCGLKNSTLRNAICRLTYYCYMSEEPVNSKVVRYYIWGPAFVDMSYGKESGWKVWPENTTHVINAKGEIMNRRSGKRLTYFVCGKWRLWLNGKYQRVSPEYIKKAYQEEL